MAEDIVFPDNNEKELLKYAVRLDYASIRFIYSYQKKLDVEAIKNKIADLNKNKEEIRCSWGLIADEKNILDAKKLCNFVMCKEFTDQRRVIEKLHPIIIFGLEISERKDFIFQKNSGINHILARLAKEKEVSIGVAFASILQSKGKERSMQLGRIMQNIVLCRKYGTKFDIFSFATSPYQMRSPKDLKAFFESLGLNN